MLKPQLDKRPTRNGVQAKFPDGEKYISALLFSLGKVLSTENTRIKGRQVRPISSSSDQIIAKLSSSTAYVSV